MFLFLKRIFDIFFTQMIKACKRRFIFSKTSLSFFSQAFCFLRKSLKAENWPLCKTLSLKVIAICKQQKIIMFIVSLEMLTYTGYCQITSNSNGKTFFDLEKIYCWLVKNDFTTSMTKVNYSVVVIC